MEGKIEGRELALKSLIKYEKSGLTIRESCEEDRGSSLNEDIQKAYDYFYGTVRHLRKLDYIISKHLRKYSLFDLTAPIRNILRLGVYGILHSKAPEYAIVDSYVTLARKYGHNGTASLVNGILRNLHPVDFPEDRIEYLSIFYSHPRWLVEKLLWIFGDKSEKIMEKNNEVPRISIRVNRLKTNTLYLKRQLNEEGVETENSNFSDYNLLAGGNVLYTDAFKEGLFSVQSVTQTLITEMLNPKIGEVILDLCSSPGGKSTGIAEIMEDNGVVVSVDLKSLHKVLYNCKRLGIKSVYPVRADVREFQIKKADRIMLDVPCSGTGTLSQKADIRWNITPLNLKSLKSLQRALLNNAAKNLKPGGILLYATCSILPEENEEQVYDFLDKNKDFELCPSSSNELFLSKIQGLGAQTGGFCAKIRRKN
jgi:16S rRNA (cytosine967-C5)-methyltransferase